MAAALDSLSDTIDKIETRARKAADEYSNKTTKFNKEYNKVVNVIIIPSMDNIMKLFNNSGHGARLSNKDDGTDYQIWAKVGEYLGYYFQFKAMFPWIVLEILVMQTNGIAQQ